MSIYAMVDYFKRLKISNLDISVKTTQEYAAGLDGPCPWEWILTIGGSESVHPHNLWAVLIAYSSIQDPRRTFRAVVKAPR
jgi:hypothetical protein